MRSGSPLLVALLLGCPGPDDTGHDTGLASFECTLGSLDGEGAFVPWSQSGTAELVLGFQGFLFLQARLQAEDGPAVVEAIGSISVDGGEPTGSTQPGVALSDDDGTQLSDEVLLFLPSSSVSSYTGLPAEVAVRLHDDAATCLATVDVVLVDDDPCIHTDQEPICPDTGVAR